MFLLLVSLQFLTTAQTCEVSDPASLASIFLHEQIFCGGIALSPSWVLTAAQCIFPDHINKRHIAVRVGPIRSYGQVKEVKKGIQHRAYQDTKDPRYDIGLLLMEGTIKDSLGIDFPRLPTAGFTDRCATGTGMTWEPNQSIHQRSLSCGNLQLMNGSACSENFPQRNFGATVLCTVDKKGCLGEKGGVVVCEDVVVGVMSMCYEDSELATFVRVESFVEFINETIANGGDGLGAGRTFVALGVLVVCAYCR